MFFPEGQHLRAPICNRERSWLDPHFGPIRVVAKGVSRSPWLSLKTLCYAVLKLIFRFHERHRMNTFWQDEDGASCSDIFSRTGLQNDFFPEVVSIGFLCNDTGWKGDLASQGSPPRQPRQGAHVTQGWAALPEGVQQAYPPCQYILRGSSTSTAGS